MKRKAMHIHFRVKTPGGNEAIILGNPQMPAKTKLALGKMIDAAAKAKREGKLKTLN